MPEKAPGRFAVGSAGLLVLAMIACSDDDVRLGRANPSSSGGTLGTASGGWESGGAGGSGGPEGFGGGVGSGGGAPEGRKHWVELSCRKRRWTDWRHG
jgi:hypothetical protein